MKKLVQTTLAAAFAFIAFSGSPASAFTHYGHSHASGCFVTTSPQHNQKGVRHWRNPCPHHERRHLNPYHAPYHRPHTPHPSPH